MSQSRVDKEPAGWRWRFEDQDVWYVQKNKPKWYRPEQIDIVIEPLFPKAQEASL